MTYKNIFCTALAVCFLSACASVPFASKPSTEIYLVRHAEKEPGRDPNLNPDGKVRAQALADRLASVGLTAIYSTNTARTRQTAAPITLKTALPVIYYDPAELDAFAAQLLKLDGHILVVGHSNTTPDLVAALGGEAGAPIVEASEYDRLYVLTIEGDSVSTDLQRYGQTSEY